VKFNNRRCGKIPTATGGRVCFTVAPINDLSRRSRYFLANGITQVNDRMQMKFFARSETSSPEFLCKS
jgi:hypothetical protein